MIAATALFLIPMTGKAGARAMDWSYATQLPWGVLILFGGGLSLAAATEATGVTAYIGSLTQHLGGLPVLAVVVTIVAITVFASELTSNTAQVALMLPLLAAAAPGLGRAGGAAPDSLHARRQPRVHDAGRHAAQRDRVRDRPRPGPADGPRRA